MDSDITADGSDVDNETEGGLYILRLSDRHFYGGRTTSYEDRWYQHLSKLRKGTHKNKYMQNVYNKYGCFSA